MQTINTNNAPAAIGPYSQAKLVNGFLYTSGQLPIDPKTNTMVEGIAAQAKMSCENIQAILNEAGYSFDDVVKTTCYLSDMANFASFNEIYAQYFTNNPARSCFAVKELPKNSLVEIEVVAYRD